ncbi:MAG TPA: hypothetical protein VGH11_05440 [Jatrophihabitans sp.]
MSQSAAAAASSAKRRRGGASIWVVLVLGALVLALLVVTVTVGVVRLGHDNGIGGLTKAQQSAVDAAKQETMNIQTYRLKTFDADFAAAVAGMTSDKAIQWQARKTELKTQLTKSKQDLGATVSDAGLQSADSKSAVVLVSSDSIRIDTKGNPTTFAQNRFQVTMKLVSGKWLMDDLQSVSLS